MFFLHCMDMRIKFKSSENNKISLQKHLMLIQLEMIAFVQKF